MKRIFALVLCIMMSVMMFVACGDKEEKEKEDKKTDSADKEVTVDIEKTADKLISDIKFVDDMSVIENDDFFLALFSIDAEDVVGQKTYTNNGATAEYVSAVECKDNEAAEKVKTAFEAFSKDYSEQYASYAPQECVKLDNPVIEVYDKYVILCISDDNDSAKKIIKEQVK